MTLSDRRRLQLADRAADHLAEIALHLGRVEAGLSVMDRIRQAMAGPAAQRTDTPRVGGHRTVVDDEGIAMPAVSDPTGEAAAALADRERWAADRAANLAAEIDRLIVRIDTMATRLVEILSAYPPAHAPSAADQLAVARANTVEPSCQVCASVRDPDGKPYWSEVYSKLTKPTTVHGRLAEPVWLCRWCFDRVATTGRVPNEAEIARYHQTGKVPWPADIPRPA